MQVVKVNRKVLGPGRGNVVFGVDGDARMITLVGIEQSQTCRSAWSIVISEFRQQ